MIMARLIHCFFVFFALLLYGIYGQELDTVNNGENVTILVNTRCYVRMDDGDSIIECRFTFNNEHVPQYFVDINQGEQAVVLTMSHTKYGGSAPLDSLQKFNKGPVKTLLLHKDFQNANQGIKGLLPDLYAITVATIKCVPIVKNEGMTISDAGRNVYIDFRWPSNNRKRKKLYELPHSGHRGLIASIATVSAAGLAVGGYFYWNSRKKTNSDILEPVLPNHPPID